jgi:hypothetical protein
LAFVYRQGDIFSSDDVNFQNSVDVDSLVFLLLSVLRTAKLRREFWPGISSRRVIAGLACPLPARATGAQVQKLPEFVYIIPLLLIQKSDLHINLKAIAVL